MILRLHGGAVVKREDLGLVDNYSNLTILTVIRAGGGM
jgi:hypothetical protein